MGRIHLFEIEDQQWFPTFLRNYMTDFLQFLSNKSKIYKSIIPIFSEKLKDSGEHQIIDLASGGGGGLLWINEELKKSNPALQITLTDYFPNIDAFKETQRKATNIQFEKESVNAMNVPSHLKGFRTQFLSFHHFQPKEAQTILQNAVDTKSPIAIFEAQDRTLPSIIAMLLSPISVLLTTPFIQPFKIGRIIFTYLLPIIPLCVLWDGIVSSLRTYSVKEMNQLINQLNNKDGYEWSVGKSKSILYLIGVPKKD